MAPRRLAGGAVIALAAALISGCGGTAATPSPTAAPTPAPTATPAPTPSPTPDPVALAMKGFAAKDMRCDGRSEGVADIAGTQLVQSGTVVVIGDSEHETYEQRVAGALIGSKEVLAIGAKSWEKVDKGPWHDAGDQSNKSVVAALADLTALTVVGQETLGGAPVTHVRPGTGVTLDPTRWGPTATGITGLTITADLWIAADGTVVKIVRTEEWSQPSGSTTVKVKATLTDTCAPLGTATTITAPTDPWVAYTSTAQGFTISQPAGYTTEAGSNGESFVYGQTTALTIVSVPADKSMTLDAYLQALAASYAKQAKASLLTSYDASAGGETCKVAVFKAQDAQGNDLRLIDAVLLHDSRAWEIYVIGTATTMDADVAHMNDSLTTLEFRK